VSTILISAAKKINDKKSAYFNFRDLAKIKSLFKVLGFSPEVLYLTDNDFSDPERLSARILSYKPDCVFNLFDGLWDDSYREIEFVRLLEQLNIKITGNCSAALEVCRDKSQVKRLLRKNNINTPSGIFVRNINDPLIDKQQFPLFIKPCFEDGSEGIDRHCLVMNKQQLMLVLNEKLKSFPQGVIIEQFIPGTEYQAAFLGKYPYESLGVSVLSYPQDSKNSNFLCFDSKWRESTKKFKQLVPIADKNLDFKIKQKVVGIAAKAGKALKCKGYFRVDIRQQADNFFVLDVNPNPDISRKSGFVRQAESKGYSYEAVIEKILNIGLGNKKEKSGCRL
jgi:D-alanine-D-alanine ligase